MPHSQPRALEAHILALPETAGSALYGMVDVLAATGTLWQQLVEREPGFTLIRPRIVSQSREAFRCGNDIPVVPDLVIDEVSKADIVILPELWLAPDDDLMQFVVFGASATATPRRLKGVNIGRRSRVKIGRRLTCTPTLLS